MQKITSTAGLKDAICQLEYDRVIKRELLIEQFSVLLERLKPVNLIKSYLEELVSTPYLVSNLFKTEMELIRGHFSDKISSGLSGYKLKRIIAPVIKFGLAILSTKSSDLLKMLWRRLTTRRIRESSSDQLKVIL